MMDKIALILVIVGALNWGGIGIFGFDTVALLICGQTAVPGHGARHRPSSHGLSTLEKRAPVGALFYFPSCIALTASASGVTFTVRYVV